MTTTINASTSSGLVTTPDNSGAIALQSNGTTAALVNAYGIGLGTATPSSGVGIAFPAAQSASTDANTLDDYEEGTFTPTLVGSGGSSGQSYSYQYGYYVKIGKMVWVRVDVNISTAGTNSGSYAWVAGFPFAGAGSGIQFATTAGYFANFGTGSATVMLEMDSSTTYAYLMYTNTGAGSPTFPSPSFIANSCRLVFQGCYIAAS